MTGGAMASEAATEADYLAATEADYLAAKTAVWWDIDECGVPEDCDGYEIAKNIKSALSNLGYHGPVTISAYGNIDYIPESVQHALSSTGVSLNHVVADDYLGLDYSHIEQLRELSATGAKIHLVASGGTAVTDSSIEQLLVDLMMDNPAPANVLIISGKNAFSAVRHLGEGYNILMSAFLPAACKTVWKWDTLVAGGSPIGGIGGVDALYRTSVWWDIDEFKLPDKLCDVHAISENIKSALVKIGYHGTVSISAYGDTSDIPEPVKMALRCSYISLNHVPAGAKDKNLKLLTDLMGWINDNPAPANILLLVEEGLFSNTLHRWGYNVLLALPDEASPLLFAAASKTVWLWPSLLAGGSPVVNGVDAAKEAKYLEAQEAEFKAAKTSVWWATDDCEIPEHCDVNAIAGNIRSALLNIGYHGPVTIFSYVDCDLPESVQRAFSSTGISLKQVPEGEIDKHILVDMMFWGFENAASNVLLISGEKVYRHALGPLGEMCNVLLSASLPAAAKTVWHWPSLMAGGSPIGSGVTDQGQWK